MRFDSACCAKDTIDYKPCYLRRRTLQDPQSGTQDGMGFLSLTRCPEAAGLCGVRPSLEVRRAGTLRGAFGRLFRQHRTPVRVGPRLRRCRQIGEGVPAHSTPALPMLPRP
jgi:hypothetical protein